MDLVHLQMIVSVFVTLPNTGTGYQTFVVQSYIDNQDQLSGGTVRVAAS